MSVNLETKYYPECISFVFWENWGDENCSRDLLTFNIFTIFNRIRGMDFLKGDTRKQALKLICQRFFQFSTDYTEIFSKCFFFWGCLNDAIKSDLTPQHSAHYSVHICLEFDVFDKEELGICDSQTLSAPHFRYSIMFSEV